jgi:hypothetical protein
MKGIKISSYEELSNKIVALQADKFKQETALKHSLQEIAATLNPLSVLKSSLHKLAETPEVRVDLTKVGLNIGADLIIDKVLGKNRSIKGFLSALMAEKMVASYINNHAPNLVEGIKKWLEKDNEEESENTK